jgi:hypothetical protein
LQHYITLTYLNFFSDKLDLAERLIFVVVEVGEADFEHTAHHFFGSNLGTLGAGDQGLAAGALGEVGWGTDVVPVLLGEGVYLPLLALALFAKLLVLAYEVKVTL